MLTVTNRPHRLLVPSAPLNKTQSCRKLLWDRKVIAILFFKEGRAKKWWPCDLKEGMTLKYCRSNDFFKKRSKKWWPWETIEDFFYYTFIRPLLLGAPFRYVFFLISVALSLSIMHAKHYQGGDDTKVVGTNRRQKQTALCVWDNKKYFEKHILLVVLSHLRILYQNFKKIFKTTFLWTSRNVRVQREFWFETETCKWNNSFPLCPIPFYLSIESKFLRLWWPWNPEEVMTLFLGNAKSWIDDFLLDIKIKCLLIPTM